MSSETRELFLKEAQRQFSEKGFYGTSIANIADALGLTKQALLHHFGSKEKLYGEVLQNQSNIMMSRIVAAEDGTMDAAEQLERTLLDLLADGIGNPQNTQLIMRELLDNRRRAETAGTWYLKPFLEALVSLVRKAPGHEKKSKAQALALVYQLLGAINYFLVSEPTLRQMFGKAHYAQLKKQYPDELRKLVRASLT